MEKQLFNYDETDIQSILDYSQHLLDRSLGEIIAEYQVSPYKTYRDFKEGTPSEVVDKEISMKSKGQYGNYIEKYFYGYRPNSDSAADFDKVGVEQLVFFGGNAVAELTGIGQRNLLVPLFSAQLFLSLEGVKAL